MNALFWLVDTVLWLYTVSLILGAGLSWLIAFGIINTRNQFIQIIVDFLDRITEPVLAPIRRLLPNLGGVDISPLIVILLLIFTRRLLFDLFY